MAGAPVEFDRIVPEETQGPMPVEAPLAAESLDSFQRVEAVMKDEDVSTLGLDSQDWEMVAEMVEDTENAATNFMQRPTWLFWPGQLRTLDQDNDGHRGEAEAAWVRLAVALPRPSPRMSLPLLRRPHWIPPYPWEWDGIDPAQVEGVWEGHWSQTYVLAEVPFAMEGVTKGAPMGRSGSNPNARIASSE